MSMCAPLMSTRDWLTSSPLVVWPPPSKVTYDRSFLSLPEAHLLPPLLTKGKLLVHVERPVVSVTFVRQLRNSRLQRYRRFLKGVPALNDKRSVLRGSYRLIRQAGLNDNEID